MPRLDPVTRATVRDETEKLLALFIASAIITPCRTLCKRFDCEYNDWYEGHEGKIRREPPRPDSGRRQAVQTARDRWGRRSRHRPRGGADARRALRAIRLEGSACGRSA